MGAVLWLGRISIERRFRFILLGIWWRRGIYQPLKIFHNRGYDGVNEALTGRTANKCNEEKQRVNNNGNLKANTRFFHETLSDVKVAKNIRR
jgi:hypothetical protein